MESVEFLEREVKLYAAQDSLPGVRALAIKLGGREVTGCGVDCYWKHSFAGLPVVRHRYNDGVGQLTIKAQRNGNLVREEVNLELASSSLREVTKLLEMQGYRPHLEIAKVSHNWFFNDVVLSWYSVMDLEGNLLLTPEGRPCKFLEVELREDRDWGKDAAHADQMLSVWVETLSRRGFSAGQESRSLWQLLGEK
jgi:adenylate cyclase class IV